MSTDDEMPQGRLAALCPHGRIREPLPRDVIKNLLHKYGKKRIKRACRGRGLNAVSVHRDIDILAARALYNDTYSPLYRLPDELLIAIMANLDLNDVLCLRQTGRVFLRIFAFSDFKHLHANTTERTMGTNYQKTTAGAGSSWPSPALPVHNEALFDRARRRLTSSESRCNGCQRAAVGHHSQYMHCHGCGVDHPTTFFSAAQRDMEPETMKHRVCVAHEGYVRLCAHKTVSWATVLASFPQGKLRNGLKRQQSEDMENMLARRNLLLRQEDDVEDTEPLSTTPHLRIACNHPSHQPGHHPPGPAVPARRFIGKGPAGMPGQVTQGRTLPASPVGLLGVQNVFAQGNIFANINATGRGRERGVFEACARAMAAASAKETQDTDTEAYLPTADEAPSFVVHDAMVAGVKHKVVTWSYTAHMDLAGLGDPDNGGSLTAQVFRDKVHEMRRGKSPARYIAPRDYPGTLQELRCVDPDRCGCLLYPGLGRRGGAAHARPCQKHETLWKLVSRISDVDQIHTRLTSCDHQSAPSSSSPGIRCLKIIYTRTIRLQGFYTNADEHWPPAQFRGRRLDDTDHTLRLQDAFRGAAVPFGWYQALHPRSYRLAEDSPYQHTTWCPNRRCRLHPAFFRDRFVRAGEEMNADCNYGCKDTFTDALPQGAPGLQGRDRGVLEHTSKDQWDRHTLYKTRNRFPHMLTDVLKDFWDYEARPQ
ncbi:hypothetical protein SCUCBS95973_007098 [Sporothrix curviconia]|uniref:F-box domain-containing protein n=1 Tax=Sporothrix curviconia TaxID=1260050 RepID=A0ABP0CBQ9_9PEZI